jgi:hypothetical protein
MQMLCSVLCPLMSVHLRLYSCEQLLGLSSGTCNARIPPRENAVGHALEPPGVFRTYWLPHHIPGLITYPHLLHTQDIAFAFDYSAKKLQAFYDQLADDDNTRDALDGRRKLHTLCETRWTSRADSLFFSLQKCR